MNLCTDVKNDEVRIRISKSSFEEDICDAICCIAGLNYDRFIFFFPETCKPEVDESMLSAIGLKVSYSDTKKIVVISA